MATSFNKLYKLAAKNRGGADELEALLPRAKTTAQLASQTDDRYLSMMTRCVFRAGFVWRVIDNKWPGFEAAFAKFNPLAIAYFSDEKLEELAKDTRIVRNFTKIVSVRHNATYVLTNSAVMAALVNLLLSGQRMILLVCGWSLRSRALDWAATRGQ